VSATKDTVTARPQINARRFLFFRLIGMLAHHEAECGLSAMTLPGAVANAAHEVCMQLRARHPAADRASSVRSSLAPSPTKTLPVKTG
jgi:hypothetical protein